MGEILDVDVLKSYGNILFKCRCIQDELYLRFDDRLAVTHQYRIEDKEPRR